MRILVLCGVSLLAFSASAQDTSKAIFIPESGDTPAKVVNLQTLQEAPVIMGQGTNPPQDCPDNAYWTQNNVALVNCGNGTVYRFISLNKLDNLEPLKNYDLKNALGLEVVSSAKPGTDKPGPGLPDK